MFALVCLSDKTPSFSNKVSEFELTFDNVKQPLTELIELTAGYSQSYIDRTYGLHTFDPHNKANKNHKKKSKNINYRQLCRKLKVGEFMSCFMDICGRVFDILHLYYKIESFLIKFRVEHAVLSEDMNIVRKSLWIETQNLLGGLLESSQFSLKTKTKMEDLLLALHGATIFKIIGQSFSGSESAKLSASIRLKCISYLDHFKKTFFESIKTNFDNEMWVVLPIPSNFGVHSIKELQRNTQWTLFGSDDDDKSSDSAKQCHDKKSSDEQSIYQKFLSGDNIFDKLVANKTKSDLEKAKKRQSNIFDSAEIGNHSIARPSDDGSEPCLTSTSLNLAKFIGLLLRKTV